MQNAKSTRTSVRTPLASRSRRLLLESLEERCLMDGATAQLVDDAFEAWTNQPATTLNVLANDEFDHGYAGQRRIMSVSYGSEGGRVDLAADRRAVVYTPAQDFAGTETFVYIVDGEFAANVTISVVSPLEDDDFEVVLGGRPAELNVLANDSFWPDYRGPRRIRFVSETESGGTVAITDGGRRIQYTPPPDDDADYDSFAYFVDDVYLVLTNQLDQPPQPKLTCTDVEQPDVNDKAGDDRPVYFGYWASRVTQTCQYETREEYAARLHAERDTLFAESLPDYSMLDAAGVTVESGVLHSAAMLARPLFAGAEKLVSIVSLDVVAAEPAIADTEGVFTGGASNIYGGLDNLYVFDQGWNSDDGTTTKILQFAWGDSADTNLTHERGPVADTSPTRARGTAAENPGDIQIVATGEVPGRMLNQYSADEFGGYLRLATTVDGRWWDFASGREHNDVFVLQADHGVLETVGLVQDIAPGETIRSTRFVGDRAFMTTFRDIDPLFALDTSDPADPRVVGSLHVPGFSSYMQPIDANHLLTVGQNTPNGWAGAPQVSLFDIRDLTRPVLIDNYTFERFSTTEAASDYHAFGWFAEHGVLAVPSGRSYWARVDTDGDGFRETRRWVNEDELLVFRIDVTPTAFSDHGIQLLGTVEQQSRVRRGAYIGDVLYSVATQSIKAVDINQPDRVIAEIVIGGSDPNAPPSVVTRIAAFLAAVDESPIGPARDPGDSGGNPVNEPVNKPPNDPVNDPPTDLVKDPPSDGGAATVGGLLADLPGASVSLVADPAAPDDTMLVIVGTDQNDRIVIRPAHRGSEITVRVNRERFGPFDVAVVDRVLLDGRGGNDSIRASKRFHTPVRVYDAAIADFTAFESPRGNAPVPVLDRSRDRALDATSLAHLMRWRFRHRTVLDDDGRS